MDGQTRAPMRVWTVPNAISFLRLACVPLFAYLILSGQALWALVVLALASASDWLDGVLARALDQRSRLGELLDPTADRLYIAVALITMAIRGLVPWWFVAIVLGREIVLGLFLLALRGSGYPPPQVNFAGKAGTFMLLVAFPLWLVQDLGGTLGRVAGILGWSFGMWGLALYLLAGTLYVIQDVRILTSRARAT